LVLSRVQLGSNSLNKLLPVFLVIPIQVDYLGTPSSSRRNRVNLPIVRNLAFGLSHLAYLFTVFGNTQTQAQPSSGLFGSQAPGLFGNTGTQQQQQQGAPGSNFLGKPTTGTSIFGSSTNNTAPSQTNPLFGNSTLGQPANQQSTSAFGGTAFGKPTAPIQPPGQQGQNVFSGSSIFGGSLGGSNPFVGSVPAQGTLTPSIDQPVGINLPIFSLLSPAPHTATLDGSKKKTDLFVDVPTRSPIPFAPRSSVPANSKLRGVPRGFASSSHLGPSANGLGSSLSFNSGKANALSLTKRPGGGNASGPESFSSLSLGSGGRDSVKKLVFDKKVALFELSGHTPSPNNVTFNPALSVAAREKEAVNGPLASGVSPTTASSVPQPSPTRAPNRFTAQSTVELLSDKTAKEPTEGEYWSKPDMSILSIWGHSELISVENLVVGRFGYGKMTFLEPVDLTYSGSVKQLFSDLVRFEEKECSVYPDLHDADKPPPGSGLNVRARLELVGCWALDKSTREPIKDENHPQAIKHVKRLKNMKDTHFEEFDIKEGKWTFTVDHF
jgi:nuclear pore complex protein Nup98-Nup96